MKRRELARRTFLCAGLLLAVLCLIPLLTTCGKQYALLLTIQARKASFLVEVFDLKVKDLATGKIVLERTGEQVDSKNPNRDISEPDQKLKVAVELAREGNYLVYILGRSGSGTEGSQFALRDYQVNDVISKQILLDMLVADNDGDGFPACGPPEGITCPPTSCMYLDCDDDDPNVHPFAIEYCKNGKDDDCSEGCGGDPLKGDSECVDNDGDGTPAGEDCDDNDPCLSPELTEAQNNCDIDESVWDSEAFAACRKKLQDEGKSFDPPFCGDGIDQNCDGKDVACITDADCDGSPPPNDCDDTDAQINPRAEEQCDKKDNNCDGVVDEGCLPCDVDGDQHASVSYDGPDCPEMPRDDPDDFDTGVHPDVTKDTNGQEGGTVLGALRQFCSGTVLNKHGQRQRDIDHDADGTPGDGCPSEACDADGDGFEGPQCNPPKAQEDCDDQDPKTFPGAPDLCGDGKPQNCVADKDCSCDGDADKYCSPADCDDSNAEVGPWATEICDKKDNDCDKLVDEGNPDHLGNLVPSNTPLCNVDNDGECAPPGQEQNGTCGCSGQKPSGHYDETDNRIKCPGEDLNASASSRCWKALQPDVERCDDKDVDCDGAPFVPGQDFVDKGATCGTNVGECSVGVVVDCNLSKTVDSRVVEVLNAQGYYNQHWVCENLADPAPPLKLPEAERCNKKDDDCDGARFIQELSGPDLGWGELAEQDQDADKYMACSGCQGGDMIAGLVGCNDCKDGDPTVFPTNAELCNNKDDNCVSGDDGVDQCTGGMSCCSSQKACRNLSNDFQNCGNCGNVCPSATSDTCRNGTCVCGSSSGACTGDRNCVSGSCQCIQNGLCSGCCSNNTCLGGDSVSDCGENGESCQACTTSNPCKNPTCSSSTGDCGTSNKSDGTSCPDGQCRSGDCCTGCWTGSSCQPGTTLSNCGDNGNYCAPCSTSNECRTASCSTGSCIIANKSDGTSCSGGVCRNGDCCTGCWTGSSCVSGTSTSACGDNGESCDSCTSSDECMDPVCNSSGNCTLAPKTSGSCGGGSGTCRDGSCCTGCWTGSSCVAGDSTSNCGDNGESCDSCSAGQCQAAVCNSGNCSTVPDDGGSCNGGAGICLDGFCCEGCIDGSTCHTGYDDSYCGKDGDNCSDCLQSNKTCQSDRTCSN